jgi:hypothetical protein
MPVSKQWSMQARPQPNAIPLVSGISGIHEGQ